MKSRLLMILLGILLVPAYSNAIVPTADVPGTTQAATEVGNTANNVQESATQVSQYQKTMAAMGTAKKSVSDYITKQKEKLQKKMEKLQKYKEQVEEYKAKAEAYKAEAEAKIAEAKEYKAQIEDGIEQAKEYKAQAEDAIDTAKNAGAIAKGMASAATDKVSGVVDSAKAKAGIENNSNTDNEASADVADEPASVKTASQANIVDTPVVAPTRRPIATSEPAVSSGSLSSGAAVSGAVSGSLAVSGGSPAALVNNDTGSLSAVSTAGGMVDSLTGQSAEVVAPALDAAPVVAKLSAAEAEAKAAGNLEDAGKLLKKAEEYEAKAAEAEEKYDEKTAKYETRAAQKIKKEIDKTNAALKKETGQTMEEYDTMKNLQEFKEKVAVPQTSRPTRASFKTSFGYGKIHTSYPLAFASLGSMKSGTTEDGVLIVPESLSMYCKLDYEKAAEKGAMDKCLKQVNAIARSEITDDISKKDIDDAYKDLHNGLVEYLTAAYFEAMDVYNESLTFKNKKVDPVLTAEAPDVQSAWIYAKEMNQILGTRINALNKLWSRSLGVKTYLSYTSEGLRASEDENKTAQ